MRLRWSHAYPVQQPRVGESRETFRVAGFARIRGLWWDARGLASVSLPTFLFVISEMPRATLCGLSSSFAVREVVLLRLFCPGSSGGDAARRAWAERSCVYVVANEKTCVSATQGGRGRTEMWDARGLATPATKATTFHLRIDGNWHRRWNVRSGSSYG